MRHPKNREERLKLKYEHEERRSVKVKRRRSSHSYEEKDNEFWDEILESEEGSKDR